MARADGAHIVLGDIPLKLDQAAPEEIQRPAYRHYFRPVFSQRIDITGRPGAQNLREDRLLWHITDWDGGEGQIVLANGDDASARKFYRSEGLDFSVPGQVKLNRSITRNTIVDSTGGATVTSEGSAWTALSGSITDTGTDTELNSITTVAESESFTPGVGQTSMKFYLYKASSAAAGTEIDGDELVEVSGDYGDWSLTGGEAVLRDTTNASSNIRTAYLTSGTHFTADVPVTFTVDLSQGSGYVRLRVYKVATGGYIAEDYGFIDSASNAEVTFTPTGTLQYYLHMYFTGANNLEIDDVVYSQSSTATNVTLTLRNHTDGTTVATETIELTNTASALVSTMNFNSTAGKAYRARVTYNSGSQHPFVDKATTVVNSTSVVPLAMLELGTAGGDPNIVAVTAPAASTPTLFYYNFGTEAWTIDGTTMTDFVSGAVAQAMAHTDRYTYVASTVDVIQHLSAGGNDYIADLAGIAGIAVCQNRLFVLTVHQTNGVDVTTYALDADVSGGVTAATAVTVSGLLADVDTTLKQQMCGTPTGARFFVNNNSVDCTVYEANIATGTCVVTEISHLPRGTRGTCIYDVGGYTFIAGESLGETGSTARSALYLIDDDDIPTRIATFRQVDPSGHPIVSMQTWQNDLWLLQGEYIWRYDLASGGVFLEYELQPGDETYARSIARAQDHVFALYSQEDGTNTAGTIWVSNTDGLYRQSSVADGGSFTTSIYDYDLPSETKTLRSIQVLTDDMPAATNVEVEVQFDQDGTWIDAGTHTSGPSSTFTMSTEDNNYTFRTVQIRVTLNTETGANTPTVKAVIVEAMVLGFEEFFEFIVLTDDEDSNFHVAGQNRTGGDVVQAVTNLRRQQVPFTLTDAYEHANLDNNPGYTCVFDTSDGTNDEVGEGRLSVRLRVL